MPDRYHRAVCARRAATYYRQHCPNSSAAQLRAYVRSFLNAYAQVFAPL